MTRRERGPGRFDNLVVGVFAAIAIAGWIAVALDARHAVPHGHGIGAGAPGAAARADGHR